MNPPSVVISAWNSISVSKEKNLINLILILKTLKKIKKRICGIFTLSSRDSKKA